MSKDPAILFYTSDFLSQCSNLTMEERGEYITLLCLQHQLGHLSYKTIGINFYGNISDDVLKLFKTDEQDKFYNEWLEEIIIKRKAYTESRRRNRKGKTKEHMKNISSSLEKHMENENENVSVNRNESEVYTYIKGGEINELCSSLLQE